MGDPVHRCGVSKRTHPTLPDAAPFLELVSISKTYPGVVALRDVSLFVAPGEVIG